MLFPIALVDDLEEDRVRLSRTILRFFESRTDCEPVLYSYSDASQMLAARTPVLLAFLDIRMKGLTGIELAKRLRSLDEKMLLVFQSTSRDYAFDAFPLHPFDYLIKPFSDGDVFRVLEEALRVLTAAAPAVSIRVARAEHTVPLENIVSVVSQGHILEINLSDGAQLRSIMTFAELEALLAQDPRFLPCNRGVLVNMDYVQAPEGDLLRMKNGTVFSLRTRGRTELLNRFMQYQISRLKGGRL